MFKRKSQWALSNYARPDKLQDAQANRRRARQFHAKLCLTGQWAKASWYENEQRWVTNEEMLQRFLPLACCDYDAMYSPLGLPSSWETTGIFDWESYRKLSVKARSLSGFPRAGKCDLFKYHNPKNPTPLPDFSFIRFSDNGLQHNRE